MWIVLQIGWELGWELLVADLTRACVAHFTPPQHWPIAADLCMFSQVSQFPLSPMLPTDTQVSFQFLLLQGIWGSDTPK